MVEIVNMNSIFYMLCPDWILGYTIPVKNTEVFICFVTNLQSTNYHLHRLLIERMH